MKETGADHVENAAHMMTSITVILAQKEGFTVKTALTITNVDNLTIDFNQKSYICFEQRTPLYTLP